MPTLVTFALEEEAAPFRVRARQLRAISILVTGMGRANTQRAIADTLPWLRPRLVLTCGYAGALHPALKIGDVVFETDLESGLWDTLADLAQPVKFFCSPKVLITAAQKAQALADTGARAVEMESEIIRHACRAAGIPSATLRAISDLAGEDLPLDFNQLTRPDQSLDPVKLSLAILKSPGSVPGLLCLRQNTRLAAEALAETLVKVLAAGAGVSSNH